MKRRDFTKDSAVSALAVGPARHPFERGTTGGERSPVPLPPAESKGSFWPDGARMVISIYHADGGRSATVQRSRIPHAVDRPEVSGSACGQVVRVRIQRRASTTLGYVRPPQGQSHLPHGRRSGRSSPGSGERDRPARARSVWPRTNLGGAIFHA